MKAYTIPDIHCNDRCIENLEYAESKQPSFQEFSAGRHSVRGPKYVIKKGKTPVLSADEARQLIDSIETTTVKGLRDRALLAVMVYTFARVGAVIAMPVEDYFQQGKRWWFRFHEKGGKVHEVPAHHKAEAHVDAWIDAAGISEERKLPLFRTFGRNGEVTARPLYEADVLRMVKVRGKAIGLPASTCCHTCRAYAGSGRYGTAYCQHQRRRPWPRVFAK